MNEDLIAEARDCLKLVLIRLGESKLTVHPDFDPANPSALELQVRIGRKSTAVPANNALGESVSSSKVSAHIEAGVRLVRSIAKTDGSDPELFVAAEFVATFVVSYECDAKKSPSIKAVDEFLDHNAMFHVWPYWREYVQSTFARAMLPQITLPMMTIVPMKKQTSDTDPK